VVVWNLAKGIDEDPLRVSAAAQNSFGTNDLSLAIENIRMCGFGFSLEHGRAVEQKHRPYIIGSRSQPFRSNTQFERFAFDCFAVSRMAIETGECSEKVDRDLLCYDFVSPFGSSRS
jgi:hypothetical protein